jgi:hypothetical protein
VLPEAERVEDLRAPLREIDRVRGHAVRVKRDPHGVGGRLEQLGCDSRHEALESVICQHEIPALVDHERRVGLVCMQYG